MNARIAFAAMAAFTIALATPAEARRHHQPVPNGAITCFAGDRVANCDSVASARYQTRYAGRQAGSRGRNERRSRRDAG